MADSGFNVAASIKMRKFTELLKVLNRLESLQCGRIYKDAEIRDGEVITGGHVIELQCGRIYKDAEIGESLNARPLCVELQCGRIYKDAEMYHRSSHGA